MCRISWADTIKAYRVPSIAVNLAKIRERRGLFRIELETYGLLNDRQFDIKKAVELFGTLLAFTEIRSVLARAQDAPLVLREVFAVGEGTLDLRDTQTGMQLETGSSDEVWDKAVEFSAIGLISFMTLINMALMVKISAHKLIVYCKKRKYKKWFE